MESFFDFIFGNIFIVVIIIAAIINFLNKGKKAENEEQRRQRPTQPSTIPERTQETRQERRTRVERPFQQAKQTIKTVEENLSKSIAEQRQEQYDRLRSQYQTSTTNRDDENENSYSELMNNKLQPEQEEMVKVKMKLEDKLTPKGLIESVIMAEVLGPPRAHNPYQNVVVKRRQKY